MPFNRNIRAAQHFPIIHSEWNFSCIFIRTFCTYRDYGTIHDEQVISSGCNNNNNKLNHLWPFIRASTQPFQSISPPLFHADFSTVYFNGFTCDRIRHGFFQPTLPKINTQNVHGIFFSTIYWPNTERTINMQCILFLTKTDFSAVFECVCVCSVTILLTATEQPRMITRAVIRFHFNSALCASVCACEYLMHSIQGCNSFSLRHSVWCIIDEMVLRSKVFNQITIIPKFYINQEKLWILSSDVECDSVGVGVVLFPTSNYFLIKSIKMN